MPVAQQGDNRKVKREPMVGVSTMVARPDGTVLEGVVQDVSDGGIKISGHATGLSVGDSTDVVLIIQGERVRYACEVRHIDEVKRFYGVLFKSAPQPADTSTTKVRRCMQCTRDYSLECNYCSHCGQRLVTR